MKRLKSFSELNEKFRFSGSCDGPLCDIIPSLEKIGDLVSHQDTPQDLLKMQAETNKILKMINDEIKATINANTKGEDGINWEKAPLAPLFILNLKQRYPQHEKQYHDLWYKAVKRMEDKFSYGGAIAIFKTYCKRENLLLEDHDYDYDNEMSEGENAETDVSALRGIMMDQARKHPLPARFKEGNDPSHTPISLYIEDTETGKRSYIPRYAYGDVRQTLHDLFGK